MNTVKITQVLRKALVDYLMTTFDPNKDGKEPELARKIRESFEMPGSLFKGPFLELIFPYKKTESLKELSARGVLSDRILDLPCFAQKKPEPLPLDAKLYSHQSKAIEKLCVEQKSIVVSSGTGSGKTECFMIPIVNDLIEDETPGVRALLIYPLNALVNDQMERLRVMLKGTSITFGRFTSELPNTAVRDDSTLANEIISREEIRTHGRMPQILITNYAMLEYLLLRPDDSSLFDSGLWKYIVLDEAHTYSGAQGIEVAMLIRRLKQRLNKKAGDLLCIATSATLVNDDPSVAADFASKLFSEQVEAHDVIFGEEDKTHYEVGDRTKTAYSDEVYLHRNFDDLLDELRKENKSSVISNANSADIESVAIGLAEIGLVSAEGLDDVEKFGNDVPAYLNSVLSSNSELMKLRSWMVEQNEPVLFDEAADYIFPDLDYHDQARALYHLVEICAIARPSTNKLPLLPAKYHIFARPPQGLWACLNACCPGRDPENETCWSKLYTNPTNTCESCGGHVYPVYLCRECGQIFVVSQMHRNEYYPATDQKVEGYEKRYFTWSPIQENKVFSDNISEDDDSEDENKATIAGRTFDSAELVICLDCRKIITHCTCSKPTHSIPLYEVHEVKTETKRGKQRIQSSPVSVLQECPRCRSKATGEAEIATSITVGGTGPLANLTYELYRQLPAAGDAKKKKLPGEGRKLLTFYDSRQGAARFAAYLQDVANRQNYRHVIPKAINECLKPDEWGDNSAPNLFVLSKKCGEIALQNKIISGDSESPYWRATSTSSGEEKREAAIWMTKKILGEFTTGRKNRQSLESMGLVSVNYFPANDKPDFSRLSREIGLSTIQVETLVAYLLDDLRYRKAIKLPSGINQDDAEFGANKGNPRFIRQGNIKGGEERWIGKTPRQFRRQYVEKVLSTNGIDASEENVIRVLTLIWDWMVNEVIGLFDGSVSDGYLLDPKHIYFETDSQWYRCKKCQRLSSRGNSLSCPHPHCEGQLELVDVSVIQNRNYYYKLFQQSLIPIQVEEHTAQLDSEKGKAYQNSFKEGHINVLSCSTTFEMGIDLGDLQAVAMSNVPPTVANYRQRAGRAGRRTSGTAYIMTWTSDRPHDQAYYKNPIEIISGEVRIPNITLENEYIVRRHVNALLLSNFLRYRKAQGIDNEQLTYTGNFFDDEMGTPHYSCIDEWIASSQKEINNQLRDYAILLPHTMRSAIEDGLINFKKELYKLKEEHYEPITRYYREKIKEFALKSGDTSTNAQSSKDATTQLYYYQNLLARMRGSKGRNSGYLIDYLSSNGLLPSYSFPLHTVELLLPKEERRSEHLRLERDLRQAITEYAPGSEIVADKRVWKSKRPLFWRDTPKVLDYQICEHCHNLTISKDAGVPLPYSDGTCPVCHAELGSKSKARRFVEPDGFMADPNSGKPAKQYVNREPNQMRSALIPEHNLTEEAHNEFVALAYNQKGKLLYVNEGKYGRGFMFPLHAFSMEVEKEDSANEMSLGFIQSTNTLHIRFIADKHLHIPGPNDQSFWLSLLYALLHGASHCLQIERRDIDGVLFPKSTAGAWEQTIVLYDNVPGGAGHVKNIRENFDRVLEEARRILSCNDCAPDTSCYHCLKDYNNQYYHHFLKRDSALEFLDLLTANHIPIRADVPGAVRVMASDPASWLYEKIRYASRSITLALSHISAGHPKGESFTWIDTLGDLVMKGCSVNLYLQHLPVQTAEEYSLASHLQVLMDKNLKVWQVRSLPSWQILIDSENVDRRFIRSGNDEPDIILDTKVGALSLLTSTSSEALKEIMTAWDMLDIKRISKDDLNPPPQTKVINVRASASSNINEDTLFSEVFDKPCIKLVINDPYLFTRDVIVNRLSKYIVLASSHRTLEKVVIRTKKNRDSGEQEAAQKELKQMFNDLPQFIHNAEHDRYIEITRLGGEKARILIGRGLDFIQADGSTKSTYIVIQDPML